ncbi:hypothetical protein GCM10009127_29040 [Alteraurantiacibacter aestuarii]
MLSEQLLIASCSLLGMMILATAMLKGWQGWLALKERELNLRTMPMEIEGGVREGAARIELADLKERIRKLEAIANGVDL